MKRTISTMLLLLISLNIYASDVGGHGVGNGGDSSEVRFNDITKDLRSWITHGGSKHLKLPEGITLAEYNSKMLSLTGPNVTVISFTDEVILVKGLEKTCKNYITKATKQPNILCNLARFNNSDEAGQYQLVHHEFAGLAGFEKNIRASSDYILSSQLTSFLAETTVLKLSVKKYSDGPVEITKDQVIKNVTICAVQCQDELLEHWGHDAAKVGVVYYAPATEDNLGNSSFCLSNSKKIDVISNRMTDYSAQTCTRALAGKYFGKVVDIYSNKQAAEEDEGTYFAIEIVKHKK